MVKKSKIHLKAILSVVTAIAVAFTSAAFPMSVNAIETKNTGIQAELFVASNGNDVSGDGSYEKPFATLTAARNAVRKINQNMTGDIVVFIAKGDYYVDDTILFTQEDSASNGHEIIYCNQDSLASARFIGGRRVDTEWKSVERTGADADLPVAADGHVYKTNVGTEDSFNTLYVNEKRATLARTQNLNQYPGFEAALTPYMRSAGGGVWDLIYKAGDLDNESIQGIMNAQARGDLDASVYMWDGGYWDWMTDTIPISAIDTASRKITYKTVYKQPDKYRPKYATGVNARYFIQGNLGFLDAPGEYYFNKMTGDLYYYPEDGNMKNHEIVIPEVKEIIRVEGDSRESMVSGIKFNGLMFTDTDTSDWYTYGWNFNDAGAGLKYYPEEAKGSTQPSYCEQTERSEFQYGSITLKNTNGITISKCHITNSGMFGIDLYLANQNTLIEDSLINNTGHGGVNIDGGYPGVAGDANGDGYSRDNMVTNTIIHDVGELIGQASGLTVQQSGYNTFSNLEIYNSPRRGIFITAGHSRNKDVPFPGGDKDFNIMTDMYSHHNMFEYIYMRDCQQDGGDDGAFFGCYLYKGKDEYRPNWINQMVLDSTGGNPTMTDLGPNNMNLDMGCSGFELSNVKSTNPMNFNMEVNTILQYKDVIKFDNTNIDYGTLMNQIDQFDDSKMEYDKIGVTTDFPKEYLPEQEAKKEYEDIWFEEDFEQNLDWSKWTFNGAEPGITTQWMWNGPMADRQGLELKSNSTLVREFKDTLHKKISIHMFDRQSDNLAAYDSGRQNSGRATSFAVAGGNHMSIGLGVDWNNMNTYSIQTSVPISGTTVTSGAAVTASGAAVTVTDTVTVTATKVPRTFGWHEFTFDFTTPNVVKLSIDDTPVGEYAMDGFKDVKMECKRGTTYYDQFVIHGGDAADAPGSVIPPEPPVYDSSKENHTALSLDMETVASNLSGWSPIKDSAPAPTVTYETVQNTGTAAKISINDNFIQYGKDKADWKNYMVNLKWKFDKWGNNNILDYAYDNFTIMVMTTSNAGKPNNPYSYQVIFRRNKNGKDEFPAGTPYFEIMKRDSGDVSLGRVKLPDGFDLTGWHDLQIQSFGGKVGFILDGEKMLSVADGSYTYGGIAMGGINADIYVDELELISNPTNVKYPANFGLENAVVKGNFNPDHFSYYAQVNDAAQPVRLKELPKVQNGAKVTIYMNEEEITSLPAELNLIQGMNRLVFKEETVAGEREYTVRMDNGAVVTGIELLAPVVVNAGTFPVLPATVPVTFEDGTTGNASIHWNMINPILYKTAGSFEVKGALSEFGNRVFVKVQVNGLLSIGSLKPIQMEAGTTPKLPDTIEAEFENGTKRLPLQFKPMSQELYAKPGTIYAIAEADGYDGTILQKVEVVKKKESSSSSDTTYKPSIPYSITLSSKTLSLKLGDSSTLTATIYPEDAANKSVTWATTNPKVATVDNGQIKAIGNGTATITAAAFGKTDSCVVTVTTDVDVTKVNLKPSVTILKGKSTVLKAELSPSTATDKTVIWTSSNHKVATVDKKGKVKGIKAGTATITAKSSNGKKAVCKVTVPGVTLKKNQVALKTKETATIKIESTVISKDKVTSYQSSNKKIAAVSSKGKVSAKKKGTATITITMKSGAKTTFKVIVK